MAEKTVSFHIGEWPPYVSEDRSRKYLAEELVTEAFAHQGYKVRYEYFPWKRSYINVKNGNSHGTFPWYVSPEREKDFIIPKEALFQEREVFFHLKSNDFKWDNFEDLKKYRIGGVIGYNNVDILKAQGVDVVVLNQDSLNFKMLLAGRIDAYPVAELVGHEIINSSFPPEVAALFTKSSKALNRGGIYILFSKNIDNAQEVAEAYDRGMVALKKSGRYDEIISGFFMPISSNETVQKFHNISQ